MRNAKWRLCLFDCYLGGNAAGPEYGNFIVTDANRIAEFGLVDVANSDFGRITEMDRCTVHRGKPGANLDRTDAHPGIIGRILTTILLAKRPAVLQSMSVRYIGTLTPSLTLRISSPSSINASSNENEQP